MLFYLGRAAQIGWVYFDQAISPGPHLLPPSSLRAFTVTIRLTPPAPNWHLTAMTQPTTSLPVPITVYSDFV